MKIQPKTILIVLGVLILAMIIWNDPASAGNTASNWVDNISGWFQDAFDKVSEFAESAVD
jgi:hypothetical protein